MRLGFEFCFNLLFAIITLKNLILRLPFHSGTITTLETRLIDWYYYNIIHHELSQESTNPNPLFIKAFIVIAGQIRPEIFKCKTKIFMQNFPNRRLLRVAVKWFSFQFCLNSIQCYLMKPNWMDYCLNSTYNLRTLIHWHTRTCPLLISNRVNILSRYIKKPTDVAWFNCFKSRLPGLRCVDQLKNTTPF